MQNPSSLGSSRLRSMGDQRIVQPGWAPPDQRGRGRLDPHLGCRDRAMPGGAVCLRQASPRTRALSRRCRLTTPGEGSDFHGHRSPRYFTLRVRPLAASPIGSACRAGPRCGTGPRCLLAGRAAPHPADGKPGRLAWWSLGQHRAATQGLTRGLSAATYAATTRRAPLALPDSIAVGPAPGDSELRACRC